MEDSLTGTVIYFKNIIWYHSQFYLLQTLHYAQKKYQHLSHQLSAFISQAPYLFPTGCFGQSASLDACFNNLNFSLALLLGCVQELPCVLC